MLNVTDCPLHAEHSVNVMLPPAYSQMNLSQSVAPRNVGGLRAVFGLQFARNARDVIFGCAFGDVQTLGDFAVAAALCQQHQHLALALRQVERNGRASSRTAISLTLGTPPAGAV